MKNSKQTQNSDEKIKKDPKEKESEKNQSDEKTPNEETENPKTTTIAGDGSTSETTNIEIENTVVDTTEFDSESPSIEKEKKAPETVSFKPKDKAMSGVIDHSMAFTINQVYLKDCEPVTSEEIEATQFSKSIIGVLNHYFPKWDMDHPLIQLAFTAPALALLLIKKKKTTQRFDTNGLNPETIAGETGISGTESGNIKGNTQVTDPNSKQLYTSGGTV